MYRGEIWLVNLPSPVASVLLVRVRIISMIEPRRREGHEGRSYINSVGIGIIHLSIL